MSVTKCLQILLYPRKLFPRCCTYDTNSGLCYGFQQSRAELYELLHNFNNFIPKSHGAHLHKKKSKPLESFADYNSAHLKFQ